METKSGEKRDEAKVGEFSRLLEAVHRFVYAKDNVGLAGGVGFKEGNEIEAGENGGGELMGEEFDVLGRVEVGAKVEVGEIDGTEERVVGYDRVEEDVDGRERGDLGGGRAGRGKTVTARSAANTAVYAYCSSAGRRGGGERRGTTSPLPRGCNTWRGRGRGGRGRGSGNSRRA